MQLAHNQLFRVDMKSNEWGLVPFVIGADTVFSPMFPEVNPELKDVNVAV
jgi:hypothetical protein